MVTLTTDFGLKDGAAAVLKGVIWKIAPQTQIADISHLIAPQSIREAALVLAGAVKYFPENTVHVVVVDPGVGTSRRAIAARINSQFFVCPDNGILTLLLDQCQSKSNCPEVCVLDKPQYWLPVVNDVFHGRDLFAPIAAHLSLGVALNEVGSEFLGQLVRFPFAAPTRTEYGWRGEVVYIDGFGNIATNIFEQHLGKPPHLAVQLCGTEVKSFVRTFGLERPGSFVSLYSGISNLIVSVVNGDAAKVLGAKVGDLVDVLL